MGEGLLFLFQTKKEGNVKVDGILFVISGLVFQGIPIYLV